MINKVVYTFTSTYRKEAEGPVKERKHGVHHGGARERERKRVDISTLQAQRQVIHMAALRTDSTGSCPTSSSGGSTKQMHDGRA